MLKLFKQGQPQTGDTIIEVLISIAIVSLAIAIAYSISGKNLDVGITARERTQALGLVQGQIEHMDAARQIYDPASVSPKTEHFCFDGNNVIVPQTNSSLNSIDPINDPLATDAGSYAPACVINGKYYLDIVYIKKSISPCDAAGDYCGDSFMFSARWYRLGGGTDQLVTIYYRPW